MNLFKKGYDRYSFAREKLAQSRHKKAWLGFLVVCGIASMAVLTGIYSIVMETNGGQLDQVDIPESGSDPLAQVAADPSLVVFSVTEAERISSSSLLQTDVMVPTESLSRVATGTDYTHDVREAAGSVMHTEIVTVVSTIHVAPATLTRHPAESSTPQTTETPPDTPLMTGLMYCLDPERSPVWTPCPLVHTSGPNMVDATEVPGSKASISAGEPGALNPLTAARVGLCGLWKTAKASITGPYKSRCALYAGRNGDGVANLEVNVLKERNRALYEGLQTALELLNLQQKLVKEQRVLLNEQQRVMEEQRLNAEEQALLFSRLQPTTYCITASEQYNQL